MSRGKLPPKVFNVSVLIPLFNKAEYIAETLASVLGQSLDAREILVVDDGSTDDGAAIVQSLDDPRIRLIQQANSGPGQARNRGIAEAKGEWIAFLDADDLWLEDHLAELARLSERKLAVSFLATSYREIGEPIGQPEHPDLSALKPQDFFALPVDGRNISSSSVAIRATALREVGGFGSAWPGEDVDLWVRLGLNQPVLVSPRVTALYRRETGGLTEQYFAGKETIAPAFMAHLDRALGSPRLRDRHVLIRAYRDRWHRLLARQAIAFGEVAAARLHLSQATPSGREYWMLKALSALPARWLGGVTQLGRATKNWVRKVPRTLD